MTTVYPDFVWRRAPKEESFNIQPMKDYMRISCVATEDGGKEIQAWIDDECHITDAAKYLLDMLCSNATSILAQERQKLSRLTAENERFKTALATIAAQSSAIPGSTNRADCMAALASAALRRLEQA